MWAPLRHHEGNLYFGSDDSTFYAFDIKKQEVRWQFETGGIIRSGADVTGGTVLFASDDGFLYVDQENGEGLWDFTPGPVEGYVTGGVFSTPALVDGVIYVAGVDGRLYALKE